MSSRAGTASTARRRALASAGALALALGLGLTGCTGGTDGPTAPTSASSASGTASTSASASPTPTAEPTGYQPATATSPAKNVPRPKQPKGMNDNTLEGQKKFIQYWVDLYNYAYETGDSHLMRLVSDSRCEFCNYVYAQSDKLYSKDKEWRVSSGVKVDLKKLKVHPAERGFTPIDVETQDGHASYYSSTGRSSKHRPEPKKSGTLRFWLFRKDAYWYMGDVTNVT